MDAIFCGKAIPRNTFHARPRINHNGNYEITFEFFKLPNADAMKEVIKAFKEHLYFLSEFFRTKNTKGLATAEADYKQVKTLQNFDEKFYIAKTYRDIQEKFPKHSHERTELINELVQEASVMLNRISYNEDDLRKTVSEFQEYFGEVIHA